MPAADPAFATDPGTAYYYHHRAPDYDDWYRGDGRYAGTERPGWQEEVVALVEVVQTLPPARTIDIACGTGFLTHHLRGFVIGLDQSVAMMNIAQSRLPNGLVILGDALHVNVADHSFERVFTGHFYGHLPPRERALTDGSLHQIYKRYLSGNQLASEIGGEVMMDGEWFVAARVEWNDRG